MRKLNKAVYNTIYKTISEAVDIKNVRRHGTADIAAEITGVFKLAVSDAYDAHEWNTDRCFYITDLEAFEEAVKDYDINVTAEQWETIDADPYEYHSEYDSKVGDLLEEVERVSECVTIEYSYTHELDGYEIAIVSREYDTFVELYDEENEEQIDRVDDGRDTDNLAARLEYYFSEEIEQACDDFFNNEVLPEFSDAVKKEYRRQYKNYYSDELEDNIMNLLDIEEDFSYHMEDDVDEATLINFKRQIKNLKKTAPSDWESLKREHKNKSGSRSVVAVQFIKAAKRACSDLGFNVDEYFDNDVHGVAYQWGVQWVTQYIEQEERHAN